MTQEIVKLNQYPDSNFKTLRETLGQVHGVSSDCICVSHGAEGMLQTIGKCFIQEGDEVLIPSATYTLYKEISKVMGATVIDVPMAQEGVDLTALQKQVGPRTKLIWIANPNNPTGTLVDKDELGKLLDMLPEHTWVVLDEAYAEFADASLLPDHRVFSHRKRTTHHICSHLFKSLWTGRRPPGVCHRRQGCRYGDQHRQ